MKKPEKKKERPIPPFIRCKGIIPKIDILKVKDIQNTLCQKCKSPHYHSDCQLTCSIIAHEIVKRKEDWLR